MQEKTKNRQVRLPLLTEKQISLSIKREDLLHPLISGNKFRKLKYNLIEAEKRGFDTLLTFGGAYSNHIAATAYAGKKQDFKTIGIIRGEELSYSWRANPTLKLASEHGMRFKFVSRDSYRGKENPFYLKKLQEEFGPFHTLPEGGTNTLAVKGCEEILSPLDADFDLVCCSVVLGFPALKGNFLREDIRKFATKDNWKLNTDYHFGGYAKVTAELIDFINDFRSRTEIPLDPVYTGKMVFGILDLIEKDYFPPETSILAIHTGGLQGIVGMNAVLKRKNLALLKNV
jgi:1-aminocyclopropane-1-carboxylate deaminase